MDLPGPLSISSLRPASSPDLSLRPFQRVSAQVMAVSGTTAILTIDGYPVVARLTTANQAAALLSRNNAQFIVTKLTDQEITLKFIRHEQAQTPAINLNSPGPELALRLLEQSNIPVNSNSMMLARAVLNQGLALTPGLLNDLLAVLSASGSWGETQANLAAALKAAGLPVTVESLALASRQATQTGEALGQLMSQLQATGQNLPPDLLERIRQNVKMLEELILHVEGDTAKLAEQLKTAVGILGQSLESKLLEQAQSSSMEKSLLSLTSLGKSLEQASEMELAAAIEKFIGDLRYHHFLNVKTEPNPGRETWSEIGLRLGGDKDTTARLRVSRDSRSSFEETDRTFTHLILQVDIKENETVEIDITLADKQISTQVTSPNPTWCQLAEDEFVSLEQALQRLEYNLKETRIILGDPQPFERLKLVPVGLSLMTVNIEA